MTAFRKPSNPFVVGELRMKTWRTLETGMSQEDPLWIARCQQYWDLQARLYGVRFSTFTMLVDNNGGFVSTYAAVLEVLPGERTADLSRVPVASAGVPSMRQ